jgi:hypothetical protein
VPASPRHCPQHHPHHHTKIVPRYGLISLSPSCSRKRKFLRRWWKAALGRSPCPWQCRRSQYLFQRW